MEWLGYAVGALFIFSYVVCAIGVCICFVRAVDSSKTDADRIISALVGILFAVMLK
jgi:hypothetical protein